MDKFEKLRTLGYTEQYSSSRHNLEFYHNVAITATYTLPKSFTLPVKDYVYRACETLIGQHPILSAVPHDESVKDPYWVRLPEIDLDSTISFQERTQPFPEGEEDDIELEKLLYDEHNTTYPKGAPNWRFCILTEPDSATPHRFTAAFVAHHAVCDGTSAKAFHRTFHQALSSTPSHQKTNQIIPSPSTPLLPTIESLHPLPLSMTYLASQLIKAKIYSPPHPPSLWTASKVLPPSPTKLKNLVLPASASENLRLLSRKHSSTITATIQTLLARALFTNIPSKYTSMQCSGAISARRFLDKSIITNDSLGVWVQVFTQKYHRDTLNLDQNQALENGKGKGINFPWPIAAASRKTIVSKLDENMKNSPIGLLKYVKDFHTEICLSKVGKDRDSGFEVTNVGAWDPLPAPSPPAAAAAAAAAAEGDGDGNGEVPKVGRMIFSQSKSVVGCAVEVSVVSGGDGCLVLCFAWQVGVVEDELVEKVIEMVGREARELGVGE
ncbi:hypothetical protein FQN54_002728 [Arachnomyces sp. PD_36]|nr:hypothetical protein FQN54_002728 [Arachnomyces sp. PD_36]